MRKRQNDGLLKHLKGELIGKKARIASSTNDDDVGKEGIIVNETQSTIELFDGSRIGRYIKRNLSLELDLEDKQIIIPGELIEHRPEDRLKKIKNKRVRTNG